MATRCTATTAERQPCRSWAVHGTDPPRCSSHGGAAGRPGAPKGNQNAVTHGAYARPRAEPVGAHGADARRPSAPLPAPCAPAVSAPSAGIDTQIDDLDRRIARLGAYIDNNAADLDPLDLVRLLDLHSKMIGRVTRVRRARQSMEGDQNSALTASIGRALDKIGKEWNIDL